MSTSPPRSVHFPAFDRASAAEPPVAPAGSDDLPAALFEDLPGEAVLIAGAAPIDLPEEFASRNEGSISLRAHFARLPDGGEFRSVHIRGPRIEILNIFHFPQSDRALPVYTLDFVVACRRPVVGVIDCKALNVHPYAVALWHRTMESAHTFFPHFTRAEDAPDWYDECRSGLDFFVRPNSLHGMRSLSSCHALVWRNLASAGRFAPRLDQAEAEAHARSLAGYKHHHDANFPGRTFLARTFGPDWSERFLGQALFA